MRRATRGRLAQSEDVSTLPVISLFVILVTFLVTAASTVGLASYEVEVPAGREGEGGQESEEVRSITVEIRSDDFVVVRSAPGGDDVETRIGRNAADALPSLGRVLAAAREENVDLSEMVLVPSPEVTYEEVVQVAERARAVGIAGLSLATTAPGEAGGGLP